ncbi:MAG: hypothetical protein U0935_09600 [Pirellulales bacterium]
MLSPSQQVRKLLATWLLQFLSPVAVLLGMLGTLSVSAQPHDGPANVRARLSLRTPVKDELLFALEKDFVELLKQSTSPDALLEAEELLDATNDNTHWTNYAQATKILRDTPDRAAIPLLLRYIVLHSRRSACHIMIPEYTRTISLIAGKELPELYEPGPHLEERMRTKVQTLCNDWWRPAMRTLTTDPHKMNAEQLSVVAARLLQQVRRDADFSGAGGKRDTVYGAYHNVYHRLRSQDAVERLAATPLQPALLPLLLAPSGYRSDNQTPMTPAKSGFPFEAVVLVGELAKNGGQPDVMAVARDARQNATVRLICLLALQRAGFPYDTEQALGLLASETDRERRLILLLSLRWGDEQATTTLLANLDDLDAEIATAAACALVDIQPDAAIPKLKRLLERNYDAAPILLLGAVAEFQSPQAKALLEDALIQAVEGKRNRRHLSRILAAFIDSWGVPREVYHPHMERDDEQRARLVLDYCRERLQREEVERGKRAAAVESLQTQLRVALAIETLRRDEYKRLLKLQGEEIVTADESMRAHEQLRVVTAEVATLRNWLRDAEARLQALSRGARQ